MKILQYFGIVDLFSKIYCIDSCEQFTGKHQILKHLSVPNVQNYYIGDLEGDYIAAKEAGYKFLHATWGYGDPLGENRLGSTEEIVQYALEEPSSQKGFF